MPRLQHHVLGITVRALADGDEICFNADMTLRDITDRYCDEIDAHRKWLGAANAELLRGWEQRRRDDPESAVAEACSRGLLAEHVDEVRPYECPSHGGPDFVCIQGTSHFYAEVTSLALETVRDETKLTPSVSPGASFYRPLTRKLFGKCKKKTRQCSDLDAPSLLVIGTLHFQAGCLCFAQRRLEEVLRGKQTISFDVNHRQGQTVGQPWTVTELAQAAFVAPRSDRPKPYKSVRRSVSAMLLCGFDSQPPVVNGLLHPDATRPFDRKLLADIRFGRLLEDPPGAFSVRWD